MAKATVEIAAVLLDHNLAGHKRNRDLATGSIGGDEGRDVALDGSFARRITHVWAARHGHVDTIELNFQFVMT